MAENGALPRVTLPSIGVMGLWHFSSTFKKTFFGGFQVISFTCVEHRRGGSRNEKATQSLQQRRLCVIVIAARESFETRRCRNSVKAWRSRDSFRVRFSAQSDDEDGRVIYSSEFDEQESLRRPVRPARVGGESDSVQEIRQLIGGQEYYEADVEAQILEQVTRIKQQAVKGAVRAAHEAIQELFSKFPNHTRVLIEYAHVEARRGNHATSTSLFSRAVEILESRGKLTYDYVLALQGWGSSEVRASQHSRARLLFQESIRAAERLEDRKGDYSKKAIVYGLHAWAMLEDKLGNWSMARDLLEKAANIQPGNAVVHQARALLEARAHNYSIARFNFRLAAQVDPSDAKCWQAWALFEAGQRRYRAMRQLFYRAYFANTKDLYTLQAWAHQEALIGTKMARNRARKLYQRCVEVSPENPYSWQSWGLLEEKCGNHQGARVLYEQGLRINPSSVPCLQAYARLERSQGNTETARRLLETARKIDPSNAPSLMESGLVEKELGNHEVAREFFKRARKIDREKSRKKRLMFLSRKSSWDRFQRPSAQVSEVVKEGARKVSMTQQQVRELTPGLL